VGVSFANFSHSAGLNANLVIFAYRSVRGGGREGGAQTKVFNFGKFVVLRPNRRKKILHGFYIQLVAIDQRAV
jgi:hypothetical protein